jgi:small ligand-binding sensory domain FIST
MFWKVGRGTSKHDDTSRDTATAIRQAIARAMMPASPDLVLVFLGGMANTIALKRVHSVIVAELKKARLWKDDVVIMGCTMDSPDDDACTVELVGACLPGITLKPFRVGQHDCPVDIDWRQEEWAKLVGCDGVAAAVRPVASAALDLQDDDCLPEAGPHFLLLQHAGFSVHDLLAALDFAYPNSAKVGGACGSPHVTHAGALFAGDGTVHEDGIVGLAFQKNGPGVLFEVVVAQGVKPVGTRLEVLEVRNGSEISKVRELTGAGVSVDGGPMQIMDMWTYMGLLDEQEACMAGRYIGVEIEIPSDILVSKSPWNSLGDASAITGDATGTQEENGAGSDAPQPDVLVRRIVGIDSETNAIAVDGPPVRLGTAVRFQIRDSASAKEELDRLRSIVPKGPIGGLLMTDTERIAIVNGGVKSPGGVPDLEAFGGELGRFLGKSEIGPLPAPGFRKHFPIRRPGTAASTFNHSSSAIYLLVYSEADLHTL